MSSNRTPLASFIDRNHSGGRFAVKSHGAYATVYGIENKPWVVKVSSMSDRYGDYVDAILNGPLQGNKHTPVILYSRADENSWTRVTVLERLEPWAEYWYDADGSTCARQQSPERIHYDSGYMCYPCNDPDSGDNFADTSEDWQKLVLWLREQWNRDLHHGNIMFRADGTAVITDPLC